MIFALVNDKAYRPTITLRWFQMVPRRQRDYNIGGDTQTGECVSDFLLFLVAAVWCGSDGEGRPRQQCTGVCPAGRQPGVHGHVGTVRLPRRAPPTHGHAQPVAPQHQPQQQLQLWRGRRHCAHMTSPPPGLRPLVTKRRRGRRWPPCAKPTRRSRDGITTAVADSGRCFLSFACTTANHKHRKRNKEVTETHIKEDKKTETDNIMKKTRGRDFLARLPADTH